MNQPTLSPSNPPHWRVAIIGSGPAGFYAAGELFRRQEYPVKVDMFDRLPTPYGLVRGGVAPDHQKIKSVTKIFDRIAGNEFFRFFGNVEFGRDLTRAEMLAHYDALLYSVGSRADRRLGIPGEELQGSHSATEFVGWYNGHPDYRDLRFNLDSEKSVVIGMGNVAIDVARILSHRVEELRCTDMADYAVEALAKSRVKEIWVVGRRGPVQAAFTPTEARELMHLPDTQTILEANALELDEVSNEFLENEAGKDVRKNMELLNAMQENPMREKKKRLHIMFQASPTEIIGEDGHVKRVRLTRNSLVADVSGRIRAEPTDHSLELETGLVFRSVGYRGEQLPDVPFDSRTATIPNTMGRVRDNDGKLSSNEFAAGWIKRGPSGVVGTNKPDAIESVKQMLDTFDAPARDPHETGGIDDVKELLDSKGVDYVSFQDWKHLDSHEVKEGSALERPRKKVCSIPEMLAVIHRGRQGR